MQVSPHVEELQRQFLNAATTGGAESSESVERLAVALEAAARLTILDALSEAVGEITSQLAPGSVDLRLRGRDVEFAVSKPAAEAAEGPPTRAASRYPARTTRRAPRAAPPCGCPTP